MTESTAISAKPREVIGKANRRLAETRQIPAVLYGPHRDTLPIALDRHDFEIMMSHKGAGSTLVIIAIEGEKKHVNAVIKEIQYSPVKGTILHVDFQAIRMDEKLHATAPFHFVGDSPGVKAGGVLMHTLREINIEALPADLPDSVDVDISALDIGDSITVADLSVPAGVEILDDLEEVVCSVIAPAVESAEGEGAEAEAAEPELIGKASSKEG